MFRSTIVLMSGRIISFFATFFIPVVLVRLFAASEFGTYKQIFLVYGTLFIIAQLGMAESLFYFLPKEPHKAGRYVLNSIVTLLAAGLLFLGILTIESTRLSALLNN